MGLDLAAELIEREHRAETPFGLYVLRADEPYAELGRMVEREVFYEFFGNTPELLDEEYGPYERASVYLCVIDHLRCLPAGVIRIILPSPAGQKTLKDLELGWQEPASEIARRSDVEVDPDSTWDLATLAVHREYRGQATRSLVSFGLFQALTMFTAWGEPELWVSIMDVVALDLVQKTLHRPFTPFEGCEPRRYLDSPSSLPVYAKVREGWERLKLIDPDMYEMLHDGAGTEAVISSPLRGPDPDLEERWFRSA